MDINNFIGKPCFYIILVCKSNNLYKFGSTKDIINRMDQHRKTFGVIELIFITDTPSSEKSKLIETYFKNHTKQFNIHRYYDPVKKVISRNRIPVHKNQTEMFMSEDISNIINTIDRYKMEFNTVDKVHPCKHLTEINQLVKEINHSREYIIKLQDDFLQLKKDFLHLKEEISFAKGTKRVPITPDILIKKSIKQKSDLIPIKKSIKQKSDLIPIRKPIKQKSNLISSKKTHNVSTKKPIKITKIPYFLNCWQTKQTLPFSSKKSLHFPFFQLLPKKDSATQATTTSTLITSRAARSGNICKYCKRRFTTKQNRNIHEKNKVCQRRKVTEFKCKHCDRSYATTSNRTRHEIIHKKKTISIKKKLQKIEAAYPFS